MAFTPFPLIFCAESSFLVPRRMVLSALPRYGCFFPVWIYCGSSRRDIYPIRTGEVTSTYMAKHIPDPIDAGWVADKICCRPIRSQTTRRGVDKSRKNDEVVQRKLLGKSCLCLSIIVTDLESSPLMPPRRSCCAKASPCFWRRRYLRRF